MSKVIMSTQDPIIIYLYSEEESNGLFGEDYIADYGIDIPDELLQRYQQTYNEFWRVQKELKKYVK